jgi:hypothetical protein
MTTLGTKTSLENAAAAITGSAQTIVRAVQGGVNVKLTDDQIRTWAQIFVGLLDLSNASAGQIKFPASQNASGDANTLDDYEEGTFTPTLGDGTNNYTLDRALGWYTKIGNMVFVDIDCRWTSIGSAGAGQLTCKTLPFTSNATTGYEAGGGIGYFDDLDTTATLNQIMAYIGANSTAITFYRAADNAAAANVPANSSGATGEVGFSISYRT